MLARDFDQRIGMRRPTTPVAGAVGVEVANEAYSEPSGDQRAEVCSGVLVAQQGSFMIGAPGGVIVAL